LIIGREDKIMSSKVDDKIYLSYLLQSLNVNELKQICRDFEIKGFSKLKKTELIDFILDSLAEEEIKDLLKQKELEIISKEIDLALKKINGEDRESIYAIKIVNPNTHEVEILFKGWNWETTSFLSITTDNIDDPERDCDCRIGSNMGFCNHFWVGFIYSLKQNYFKISDWTLTKLPDNFESKIKSIKLSAAISGENGKGVTEALGLIDESSDSALFMKYLNSRITVYKGEITEILEKQSDFQGNVTIYYIVSLKDVEFGPQLKKASDYNEDDIIKIENLKIRISDNSYNKSNIKIGEKIKCNGGLNKDNFWGYILKRVTKLTKI
jgi:hypothetical protein